MKLIKNIITVFMLSVLISTQILEAWNIKKWLSSLTPRTKKVCYGVSAAVGATLAGRLALHWYVGSLVKKVKASFDSENNFDLKAFAQGVDSWRPMGKPSIYNFRVRPWLAHRVITYNNGELEQFTKDYLRQCKKGCNLNDEYCCGKVAFQQLKDHIHYYKTNKNNGDDGAEDAND